MYRDRPRADWPIFDDHINMVTEPLDAQALLEEAEGGDNAPLDSISILATYTRT
ncbi:MAG: hypothetical protein U0452_12040 [Anaerolineae bacterium]